MFHFKKFETIFFFVLFGVICVSSDREVLVVSSGSEPGSDQPGVLEIYDFLTRTWRAVEKTAGSNEVRERYRSTVVRRPGTARLVEDDAFMQYDLRNGNAVALAEFPPDLMEGSDIVNYGDTICVVGGFDDSTKTARKSVSCWNPLQIGADPDDEEEDSEEGGNKTTTKGKGWLSLPPMQDARHQPGATVVDGKFFVAGGYDPVDHTFLKSVEVFDDVTKKWYRLADLNFPRAELRLLSVSGKLYAIGGRFQHKHSDAVEEYDPLRNQWRPRASLKFPRAKFGAVTRNKEIYVVGGIKGFRSEDELKDLEMFSPAKNAWATIQPPMTIIKGPVRATIVKDQF